VSTFKHRLAFTALFFILLNVNSILSSRPSTVNVTAAECLRDRTMEWTDGINIYMREHVQFKNAYMIWCGFLMDFIMVAFLILFYLYWRSTRMIFSVIILYGARAII